MPLGAFIIEMTGRVIPRDPFTARDESAGPLFSLFFFFSTNETSNKNFLFFFSDSSNGMRDAFGKSPISFVIH